MEGALRRNRDSLQGIETPHRSIGTLARSSDLLILRGYES